jgi:trehalose synthase
VESIGETNQLCREVIANAGIDINRPLVAQVSRFDPWKDPMGVIEAYRISKPEVPGLQLALVGAIAGDDPEGWQLLALVQKETADDDDAYGFTNLAGVGSMEVNAFQRACDVVVQKSLREGFGLVVSESFWKGKPLGEQ